MASLSLQVFVCSAVILIFGLAILSWSHGLHLKLLEPISLKEIELNHPHIPSIKVIVVIFLCSIALLIVSLQAIADAPPFNGPYESLYLASIFVLGGAIGILAELLWKGAKQYAFAFISGTAIAFVLLIVRFAFTGGELVIAIPICLILIGCLLLAWRVLFTAWERSVQILAVLTVIFWILLYVR